MMDSDELFGRLLADALQKRLEQTVTWYGEGRRAIVLDGVTLGDTLNHTMDCLATLERNLLGALAGVEFAIDRLGDDDVRTLNAILEEHNLFDRITS